MALDDSTPFIDVVFEPEVLEALPGDERPSRENTDSGLALWGSATRETQLVLRQGSAPVISVNKVGLPALLDTRMVMLAAPQSEQARSYRLLRHRLLSRPDSHVVAITSSRPGEGKTTCALNLALALAEETMTRVLLIEANLLRPELGRIFGFEPDESLMDSFAGLKDVGPPYPVAAIDGTRLHVAALPRLPSDARLDRTLFAAALFELREVYDHIVIDAASVFESADADIVGECSSGVVLTVRAGVSRTSDLRRAIDLVVPATILGTVLFDAQETRGA